MSTYYQEPQCIEPLDVDVNKKGKKSDHKIVIMSPIAENNSISARVNRAVKIRPYSESRMSKMTDWLVDENWECIYSLKNAHEKAQKFQELLVEKYTESFPEKTIKYTDEDQPWMTEMLKKLDRKRKRVYAKKRRSNKWREINKKFKREVKIAKKNFYKKFIENLKFKDPAKWYSSLKRLASYEVHKREDLIVSDINHLSEKEQVELIADSFAKIQN